VLILGSLPGVRSLELQQYYAHPRNHFWRIMGSLVGALPTLPYLMRTATLKQAGIALWDVCLSADRVGSLDSSIRGYVANDFASFLAGQPLLELVAFNGQKAAALYRGSVLRQLPQPPRSLRTQVLPSTSIANAGMSYGEKLRRWCAILPFCRGSNERS
jgi:hypoxanthine-DNA glycosylase